MIPVHHKAIICVSEDIQRVKIMERILSDNFGKTYAIEIAESLMEVMDIIATLSDIGIQPSVLVADDRISDMTGLELIQMVYRKDNNIKTMLMSEEADINLAQKLVNNNIVYALIKKPINWNHFLQLIDNAGHQYDTDTELFRIIRQLKISEEEKRLILESISESIVYVNMKKEILWKNSVADKELLSAIGNRDGHLILSGDLCEQCAYEKVFESREPFSKELAFGDAHMLVRYFPVYDKDVLPKGMVITTLDITERVRAVNMNASLLEMSRHVNQSESLVPIYNKAFQLIDQYFEVKLMCMTGEDYDSNYVELYGENLQYLNHEEIEMLIKSVKSILRKNKHEALIVLNNDLGTLLAYPMHGKFLLLLIDGDISRGNDAVKFTNIIAENIRMGMMKIDTYRKMVYQANHDSLTGLFSREYFLKRLDNHLRNHRKTAGAHGVYSLAVLDLNYFRDVNDNLSHLVGDEVLLKIAQRLNQASREGDVVARIGGDKFAVLFQTGNKLEISGLINRLQKEIQQPLQVDEISVNIGSSFGIVYDISAYEGVEQLMHDAEQAMHEAKKDKSGIGRVIFFEKSIQNRVDRHNQIEQLLKEADFDKELTLVYQPIVRIADMDVVGYEGYVRWTAGDGQRINPNEFIQIAEASGQIINIGNEVLHMAIEDLRHIKDKGLSDRYISINMTSKQLADDEHIREIKKSILKYDVGGKSLHIDMNDCFNELQVKRIVRNVNDLRDFGIKVDLDDFGSGEGPLRLISRFNIDALKIDRKTIGAFRFDEAAATMVKSILSIAEALGLSVIAEGVEKAEELKALRALGCDFAQGYYFMKPSSLEDALTYEAV